MWCFAKPPLTNTVRLWCYALSAISRRLATAVAHLLYITSSPAHLTEFRKDWPGDGMGEDLSEKVIYWSFSLFFAVHYNSQGAFVFLLNKISQKWPFWQKFVFGPKFYPRLSILHNVAMKLWLDEFSITKFAFFCPTIEGIVSSGWHLIEANDWPLPCCCWQSWEICQWYKALKAGWTAEGLF